MNVDEDPSQEAMGSVQTYLVQQKIDERYQSLFKKSVCSYMGSHGASKKC